MLLPSKKYRKCKFWPLYYNPHYQLFLITHSSTGRHDRNGHSVDAAVPDPPPGRAGVLPWGLRRKRRGQRRGEPPGMILGNIPILHLLLYQSVYVHC